MHPLRITSADWTTVPWRNGRGTSQAILSRPDLVLNRTPIVEAASFSAYPGFDRLLVVLTGSLELTIDGQTVTLAAKTLCRFPGEAAVTASPAGGCLVFNVLAQRDSWRIGDARVDAGLARPHEGTTIVHVAEGTCEAAPHGALPAGDTLLAEGPIHPRTTGGWSLVVSLLPQA